MRKSKSKWMQLSVKAQADCIPAFSWKKSNDPRRRQGREGKREEFSFLRGCLRDLR